MKLIPCDSTMTNVASLSIYTYWIGSYENK
jgi:hypothetical protein